MPAGSAASNRRRPGNPGGAAQAGGLAAAAPSRGVGRRIAVVRRLYAALQANARDACRRLCDPAVEWRFMPRFPHGRTHIDHAAVFEGVFPALMRDFDRWDLEVDEVLGARGAVVGVGRYRGRARATGVPFVVEFAHVFRVRGGRIVRVQQFTDTAVIVGALAEARRAAPLYPRQLRRRSATT